MKEKDLEQIKESITLPPDMADTLAHNCAESDSRYRRTHNIYSRVSMVLTPILLIMAIGSTSLAAYHVYQEKCIAAFLDYGLTQETIEAVGEEILKNPDIASCRFISGEEAWEDFKENVLDGDMELIGEFNENPLADSCNYEVRVKLGSDAGEVRRWLRELEGIRRVSTVRDLNSLEDFE